MNELTYLHYKEPLLPVKDGYGYFGALAQSKNGNHVQCHICGAMVENLGHHAYMTHSLKAKEYRVKFRMSLTTPLCSDSFSSKCKTRWLDWYNTLSQEEKLAHRQSMVEAQKVAVRKPRQLTLEELNRKGICPDQLIDKIQECAKSLGKTPSRRDFINYCNTDRFRAPIERTFGTWTKALEIAGYAVRKQKTGGAMKTYSDETLIRLLQDYHETHKQVPTASDCMRGFLPSLATYIKRFGGIKAARKAAGLPEHISTQWRHVNK